MLFNSFQYWILFLIVAALFYSLPFRFGKILLLLGSYVFYMWWDPRFIVLILTSTIVDYYLGIFLETAAGGRRKLLLIVSLVVNLGILGFFKYYDFFAGSLAALLRVPPSSVVLQVVLPVGVSFYTFASLSYTFDVYWGKR
jgi:alginate O-acetyltransferase complex protein AlgI